MRAMSSLSHCALASALLCSTGLVCSSALPAQEVAPTIRIVDRIDESNLVTLKGNTHPAAIAKNDRGRVSPDLPMTDLILVLSRSPEQQAAFEKFVAGQYDPNSPDFHHWLQPEEVGEKFGPAENDIAAVSNWLTGHGFSVDEVTNDRMSIRFSGTAAQVESAFHTEIHNLVVKNVAHIGNMTDPKIPAALAPAVVGVKALHNFFPRPEHTLGHQVTRDAATGKWKRVASTASAGANTLAARKSAGIRPEFGISVPASGGYSAYQVEDVAPYDFATIYNILPVWNAGTDGSGQTIAIAGTSSIVPGDVTSFRSTFGLPAYGAGQLTLVSGNSQPPTVCTSTSSTALCGQQDLIENSLDVEWSGAIAKGANVVLVSSYPASASDDNLYDSESYIVNHKPLVANIMNVSYGECELFNGTAGNVQYYNLWQAAASEGIAVFVAAGDSAAASCDQGGDASGTPYAAEYGLSVSGLASTPYNTAVGGTDFNWCSLTTTTECTPAPYWNSTNASNGSSVSASGPQGGYVPEVPWNDTCANPLAAAFLETQWAEPLGVSGVTNPETACNFVIDNFQSIYYYYGVDLSVLVDTVGGSGGASGCVVSGAGANGTCTAGSTSTGATTNPDTGTPQASIPLYNNGWPKPSWQTGVPGIPQDGVRDLPDVSFFASDGFLSSSAYLICVSDVASCTYSTKSEPFAQEVGGTSVATPAMAGVMALINQKSGSAQGSPNAELYKLAAKESYSGCSAENGTTGNGCNFNDIDAGPNGTPYNIATPCDDGALGYLSPNCTVLYSADQGGVGILSGYNAGTGYDLATGLGSLNVANVVNNWTASSANKAVTVTVTPAVNSLTADQSLSVSVTVASSPAGGAAPTGSVTLSGGGYTSPTKMLTGGAYTFSIPGGSLSAGGDTLTVAYSGDTTYAPASGTALVTVTKLTPTMTVVPSQNMLNSNQQLTVTGAVTGTSGTPTGMVTLSGDGYTSGPVTLSNGSYSITIPDNALGGPSGNQTLVALYSGDAIYNSTSASATVMLTYITPLIPTVTVTPASTTLYSGQSLQVTATVTGSGATPAGTVSLSGGGYSSTSQPLTAGVFVFTIPGGSLNVGPDPLTVAYSGDANYASGSGVATVTVSESAFTLAAGTATPASISAGQTATSAITVSSTNGYPGTVTLTCTAATTNPANLNGDAPICTSTNGTGVAVGGSATFTISNIVAATTGTLAYPKLPGKSRGWTGAGGGAVLALLLFLGIPARRRNWRSMLGVLAMMAVLGSLTACGGGGSSTPPQTIPGTTAGSYTFLVTGAGTPSVTPAPTPATFTVTVN